MNPPRSNLTRFVRAVHRRHVVLCIVEHAGLGLLGGAIVAVALVAVLLWRGQEAWTVAGAALGLGALAGAVWGIIQRPTPLASAVQADRQLRTADLLSTAWVVGGGGEPACRDPFRQAVLAAAAARCEALALSDVLLHRLGVRAWGGIALAIAFVGTLAALSANSPEASAVSSNALARADGVKRDRASQPIIDVTTESGRLQRRTEQNPSDERNIGEESTKPGEEASDASDAARAAAPNRPAASSGAGEGNDAGRTNTPDRAPLRRPGASSQQLPAKVSAIRAGADAVGGAGRASQNPMPENGRGGGNRTDEGYRNQTTPWSHPSWHAAAETAHRAVQAGNVAADYRDLVRQYFDRSLSPPETPLPQP